MYRGRQRRVGNGNGMLYMLALHATSQFMRLPRKPPVTASLIVVNTLVYLRPAALDVALPRLHDVCLNPYLILKDLNVKRLLLSAFYHVNDAHLVYNMISLLWKGVQLEDEMGSAKFAGMLTVLLGLSHGLVVVASKCLDTFADIPRFMYSECSVGFSSVLFALKTILNHSSPDYTNLYGVLMPTRYGAWAELLYIQMFVPGSSFLGHLCGILAGLIYIQGRRVISLPSFPFSVFKRFVGQPVYWLLWPFRVFSRRSLPSRGRIYGHGLVGSSTVSKWRCQACTFDNGSSSTACDMCGTPRSLHFEPDASESSSSSSSSPSYSGTRPSAPPWPETLTNDELRRARLARFNN